MKKFTLGLFLSTIIAGGTWAQDFKMPAPSPATTISQEFSTSKIEINYSRPAAKGRKIFGELIPYGKEWRTGANGASKITFGEDVMFGKTKVPAGTYSIYTVPNKDNWQVILNAATENWGLSGYDKGKNIAVETVKTIALKDKVESFTIAIENLTNNSCSIAIAWEHTKVVVPVKADNTERIEQYLAEALASEKPPYLVAAKYYLEKGKNLNEALDYANKAMEANPKAFYIHWIKAEILDALGQKSEAVEEAKIAAEGAKGTPYEGEYKNNYNKLKSKN
jgi:tetratricopeptide (TPR) repeat protein